MCYNSAAAVFLSCDTGNPMKTYTLLALAALLAAGPTAAGAAPLFPFVLPWDDASRGTLSDVSFLNAKPAGSHGFIAAKNGHFIEAKTGRRIRFLGTNFAAEAAFPSHADAEKVAARIAKLGINLVRLHHLDNGWSAPGSLLDLSQPGRQRLSAAQFDKLDYLVAQFKKNGVYVNFNLHVGRTFTAADGFPASVAQIPTLFNKRVDEFDPRMIALQKKYARDLLTHVNPYTHLPYASDPAVAMVEINNENSLVGDPWATLGAGLDTLPEPFRAELVRQWNAWLVKKYGTDAALLSAWTAGVTPTGPGLLSPASPWSLERQTPSQTALSADGAGIKVSVAQTDGTDWHVQAHQTGLDLHDGAAYTVTFRAKADPARALPVAASVDQADWHNVGLSASAALTPDWKPFTYVFTAHSAVPGHSRLAFTLGGQIGTVWIEGLQIHPGADSREPGQSLARRNMDIPATALKAQQSDWLAFLADTERSYADQMRGYLRKTLHVHANLTCSQMGYGGLTSLGREDGSDFADNHAYWQHPSFPHKPWDGQDWTVDNTPMAADLASGGGGTLRDLAEYRVAGKPYTVSEYNHPAPSDFRAEALPEIATFAAFQDWDAVYLYDYGAYGAGAANDKINGFFGIGSDPAKTAFLPAAALIFRAGEILPPPEGEILFLSRPADAGLTEAKPAWEKAGLLGLFSTDLSLSLLPDDPRSKPGVEAMCRYDAAPGGPPLVVSKAGGGQYLASGRRAQAVTGFVGGQTVTLGTATVTFPKFGNNFAALTLTAMDRKPINTSRRLLLTLAGKVENQDMGWNAARTSVGDRWGHGPTVAEGIPATVALNTDGPRAVWALGGTGAHRERVPAAYAHGTLTFSVGPQFKTLWYGIE